MVATRTISGEASVASTCTPRRPEEQRVLACAAVEIEHAVPGAKMPLEAAPHSTPHQGADGRLRKDAIVVGSEVVESVHARGQEAPPDCAG